VVALPPQDDEASPGLGVPARPLLEEVIALVADWGTAAMPGNEEIARVLRPASGTGIDTAGALERARAVVARAGPLLPAELVSRLGGFEAIELDTPAAPAQVRVRLALWWNEVEDALGAELSSRRAAVAADLARLAQSRGEEVLEQSLAAIGSGHGALDASALLDRIEELARIRALLADPLARVPGSGEGTPVDAEAVSAERIEGLLDLADAASAAHRRSGAVGLGSLLVTAAETIRAHLVGAVQRP